MRGRGVKMRAHAYNVSTGERRCGDNAGAAKFGIARVDSLRRNQFGDLAHRRRRVTEQQIGDAILAAARFERKRIARGETMIEHEAREQETAGIATTLVDAIRFPREINSARGMVEHARGAPCVGFVGVVLGDLAGEGDGAVDVAAEPIAEGYWRSAASAASALWRPTARVSASSATMLPVPSQIEPRWASRNSRAQANSST